MDRQRERGAGHLYRHGVQGRGEDPDVLTAGSIRGMKVVDADGDLLASATGLKAGAAKLTELWDEGFEAAAFYLSRGDDRVIGSKFGDYVLFGGPGNDVMTGGRGADWFNFDTAFYPRKGGAPQLDIITDFDPLGEDHDFLLTYDDYTFKAVHRGRDTMVTIEDGARVLLRNVDVDAFQVYYDGLGD